MTCHVGRTRVPPQLSRTSTRVLLGNFETWVAAIHSLDPENTNLEPDGRIKIWRLSWAKVGKNSIKGRSWTEVPLSERHVICLFLVTKLLIKSKSRDSIWLRKSRVTLALSSSVAMSSRDRAALEIFKSWMFEKDNILVSESGVISLMAVKKKVLQRHAPTSK